MYEGLHHVSVLVTDIDKARSFYTEKLQFEENTVRATGMWYQVGSTQIHLIVHPEGKARRGTTEIDGRDGHFAVRVTDMAAMLQRLEQSGIPFLNRPNGSAGWHQVYITDPDGNIIEFQAVPKADAAQG
ncbi:MAG: glyoxalase/bleomycin resistance protein/dioxygenase [Paenibacillus sp.]|nr:glyoxalase/bleomycin resistance protein/dioxygenase [Paenibacillus sp.]